MGRVQKLRIVRLSRNGAYLSAPSLEASHQHAPQAQHGTCPHEVLLPNKFLTPQHETNDIIEVFVLTDSDDRPIATTQKPKAQCGDIALLPVVSYSPFGCFLDLGVDKHIFMPCKQPHAFYQNQEVLVAITLDKQSRLIAKQGIKKFLKPAPALRKDSSHKPLQAYIFERTPLGFGCVVEHAYFGLLYANELPPHFTPSFYSPIQVYVKGKNRHNLDLTLFPPFHKTHKQILLESMPLRLDFSDSPERIFQAFHISKKLFKRLINELIREDKIYFESQEKVFKLTQKEIV